MFNQNIYMHTRYVYIMTQYRISQTNEERMRKFMLASNPGKELSYRRKSEWAMSYTFDEALAELLTAAGF